MPRSCGPQPRSVLYSDRVSVDHYRDMTELAARMPVSRPGVLLRLSRASAAAVVAGLLALGLVHALDTTSLSFALALAGGLALTGFLLLAIRHYDTAIAIGLLLMGVVRFEPAPPDIAFAVIMCVAAVTGRFRLGRVPVLLRWMVAVLLVVNLASMIDVVSVSVALHVPIPGRQFINGSADNGERASGLFKDPNVFGPFLIPIALILLEQHIAPKAPRLLRLRAASIWLCLLALTLGVLFSYSRAAWANFAIAVVVMLAASSMRRAGARRALRALMALLLVGALTVVILSATGSIHFLEERAHLQSYDTQRFAAQSYGWNLGWTHPLGVGPGQFLHYSHIASHSTFVRVFAEQGFLGLLGWVALLLATLVLALRNVALGRDTHGIGSAALLGAWCGLIFNSTVVDTLHWRHLWVITALIWAGAARRGSAQSDGVWTALGLARPN